MAKVAFVFPGQGSQEVGMGRAIFDQSKVARSVFEKADETLGEPLSKLCFEGPQEQLQLTANTQPAVLTTSIALFRALGETCDMAAGHSLGEYSAHVAVGTLGFEDALRLVRMRGQFMQDAVPVGHGAMAAVLGGDRNVVQQVCADTDGIVQPVNYNAPGQVVIAGQAEAVQRAAETLRSSGCKVRALPVSAPFHSSLMKAAEERLEPHLLQTTFDRPAVPVYVNVEAAPVTEPDAARDALIQQVSRPVLWHQSVQKMLEDGVGLFVEVGHGKVLSGLIGRIDKGVTRMNVESADDFEKARAAIRQTRDLER